MIFLLQISFGPQIQHETMREVSATLDYRQIAMVDMSMFTWTSINSSILLLYAGVLFYWYRTGGIQLKFRDFNGFVFLTVLIFYSMKHELDVKGTLLILLGIAISNKLLSPVVLSADKKALLITGCDRGIGKVLAENLDKEGFTVYAGCLDNKGQGRQELINSCSSRLHTMQLDVCDEEQIKQAAITIQKDMEIKGIQLWGVINNAGICLIGNVEMMVTEDIQKILAVNYLGPVTVCKHFLPLLRQSQGRIVNIASNCGLAPVPMMGAYCASKSALATMSEVWRYELKMWKIKVCTIIPSGYKTGIMAYDKAEVAERWWSKASDSVKKDYGKDCFYIKHKMENPEAYLSSDFTDILKNVNSALLSTRPKSHYYSGFLSRLLPFLYNHLPQCIGDPVMSVVTNWFDFVPKALTQEISFN